MSNEKKKKQIEDGTYESPAAAVASVKDEPKAEAKHEPEPETTPDPPVAAPLAEAPAKPSTVGPTPRETMVAFQKACWLSGMSEESFFDMIQEYFDTEGHPRTRAVANQNLAGIPTYPEIKTTDVEGGFLYESAIRGSRFGVRFTGTEEAREKMADEITAVFKDANDLNPLDKLPKGVELA